MEIVVRLYSETIMNIIIMRGLPGSGKSHRAKELSEQFKCPIFASDNYWIEDVLHCPEVSEEDRIKLYKARWNGRFLKECHQWVYNQVIDTYLLGNDVCIVDSVNATKKDFQRYLDLAENGLCNTKIQYPESDWWCEYAPYLADKENHKHELDDFAELLEAKNSHGVPFESIRGMINKWEILSDFR